MAEQPAQNVIASTWPPPPPFWRDFASENLERIEDLRKEQSEREGVSNDHTIRIAGLPPKLRNLQPPAEPEDGKWRVFGDQYALVDELPNLEDQQIRRLFPDPAERDQDGKHFDRALILKRLAKSLLLNFLELVGLMSINPSAAQEKITDVRDLFINFHHLINEYRPHQARESLISLMQSQLDQTRAETNAIRDVKEKVERILEGLASLRVGGDESVIGEKKPSLGGGDDEGWAMLREDF